MITKPKDYDDIQISNGESLKAGGHKCIIKQIEEAVSRQGNQMLVIYFDTADDDIQPHFYMNRFLNDTRADKKWGCRYWLPIENKQDKEKDKLAKRRWKWFNHTVVEDNDGFEPFDFSGAYRLDAFKGMKIGLVFRKEEYNADDHQLRISTKVDKWCNYDRAFEQEEPELKKLPQSEAAIRATTPAGVDYGFVNVPADALEDEGLPFA